MQRDPLWLTREGMDIAVACLPRVGSNSISKAVMWPQSGKRITKEEALERKIRLFFIRHPITRVHSTFSMFRAITEDKPRSTLVPLESIFIKGRGVVKDYEAFIDYILIESNIHWNSQIAMVTLNGVFIPNRVHRFEDINEEWGQYGFTGELPWEKAWLHQETTNYRHDDLREKYMQDLTLWEASSGNRHPH